MVAVQARLDDVLLSTKGKRVDATETTTISVPGIATDTGKAKRITVDISPEGKKELEKLIKAAQEKTADAWAPLLALADIRVEARAASKPKKTTTPTSAAAEPEDEPLPETEPEEAAPTEAVAANPQWSS